MTYAEKLRRSIELIASDMTIECEEVAPVRSCLECREMEICGVGVAVSLLNKLVETTLNETNPPACVLNYHNGRVYGFCPRCGRGVESGCDCGFCGLEIDWSEV